MVLPLVKDGEQETKRKTTMRFHPKFNEAREELLMGIPPIRFEAHQQYHRNLFAILGYLTTWAMHAERYAECHLYGDKDGCVHATYRDANGTVTYQILAQLGSDGTYTTHS